MNSSKAYIFSLFVSLLIITSCSDSDDMSGTVDVDKCEATVTINGNKITERFLPATYISNFNPVFPAMVFGISIVDANAELNNFSIAIQIPEGMVLEEKRYTFDASTCDLTQDMCAVVSVLGTGVTSQDETAILDITFTEVDLSDGGCIKGYFSGSYLEEDTGELIQFSDGQFFKFVNELGGC